ncbi:MAG: DUF4340 domain-containing protein [Gammaproteobacteria bacterium]
MNKKNFGILVLIAGACIVLALASRLGDNSDTIAGNSAGTPFLQGLAAELDAVDGVRIDGPGLERLVSLDRGDDGWVIEELGGYPADRTEVNALLIALGEAIIVEEKTADPEFHERLGVEDIASPDAAGVLVSLTSGGARSYSAVFGGSYSGEQRYARIADSDQSVLIDRDPDIPTDPTEWVLDRILDLDAGRVQRVEISHQDGESLIIRKDARADTNFAVDDIPADRELQYAGIADVTANLVSGLSLDEVERRPATAAEPETVIEFWTFDGLVVQVTTEAAADDGGPWLSFSARFDGDQAAAFAVEDTSQPDISAEADEINARLADWRYRIPSYKVGQLTRRMDDLLLAQADE